LDAGHTRDRWRDLEVAQVFAAQGVTPTHELKVLSVVLVLVAGDDEHVSETVRTCDDLMVADLGLCTTSR
jgi:hypothetical protein